MPYFGEIAALATAFCWSWTAIFFTSAGQRIGSLPVNVWRLTIATGLLFLVSSISYGANPGLWYQGGKPLWLILSGVVGLAVGDSALFYAYVLFGPRKTTLTIAFSPVFTALIALWALDEKLSLLAWLGIIITTVGVFWVVFERTVNPTVKANQKFSWLGLTLGVVAALGQAVGLILAKAGMNNIVSPLAATFLRIISGAVVMWLFILISRQYKIMASSLGDRKGISLTLAGSIFGPFIGIWLSLVSVRYAETGIAATLMGLVPIMIVPWVAIIYKEKVTLRAIAGTLIAVAGSALLFNR
ncbi:MAG: DMT family transporter [Calditrichaeota bacterium]|nr:DMT family transporter [Calditrichota bacterium]